MAILRRGWRFPGAAGIGTRSVVHPGAFGDLVDGLAVFAQRQADDGHLLGQAGFDGGTVGGVVAGFEHILGIERQAGAAALYTEDMFLNCEWPAMDPR